MLPADSEMKLSAKLPGVYRDLKALGLPARAAAHRSAPEWLLKAETP